MLLLETILLLAVVGGAFEFPSLELSWFEKLLPELRQQNRGYVLVSRDMYRFFRQFALSQGNDELLFQAQRGVRPIFALQDLTLYRPSQRPEKSSNSAVSISHRQMPTADE